MQAKARRLGMGALLVLGAGAAFWHFSATPPEPSKHSMASGSAAPANTYFVQTGHGDSAAAGAPVRRFRTLAEYEAVSRYGRLPNSLTGLDVHWNIASDANGRLVVTRDLAGLFEFFLSAHTEEGMEKSQGRIEEYQRGLLPQAAAGEALDILRAYLAYKQGLKRFEPSSDSAMSGKGGGDQMATLGDIKAAMNQRAAARRQFLGTQVADAFFKDDEAYDAYTIGHLEAQANASLNPANKESMIAQAELLLPAEQRARVQQERKEAALNQRIEALRAQGGNDETIRSLRTELYGAQEAQRLAMVDQEHAAWMQRLQNYRNAKDGILRQSALSAQAKDLMVKDLERSQFSAEELREVQILESIRAQNGQAGRASRSG